MARTTESERMVRVQIAEAERAEAERGQARATRLFDLRMVIGGLLGLYGVTVTLMGLFASGATRTKAAGINIDLWTGLAMLAVGVVFVVWVGLRPLRAEELREGADAERQPVE